MPAPKNKKGTCYMKNNMFLIYALFTIANFHGMGDISDDPYDKKITNLMNEIELATAEILELRVRATCLESTIRSSIKGFEYFKILGKIPPKMNREAKRIKSDAVTAQLEKANMTDTQKTTYKEAVLHLFELNHEGMGLECALHEMKKIIEANKSTSFALGGSIKLACLLL